jgi:hypothetical protein
MFAHANTKNAHQQCVNDMRGIILITVAVSKEGCVRYPTMLMAKMG